MERCHGSMRTTQVAVAGCCRSSSGRCCCRRRRRRVIITKPCCGRVLSREIGILSTGQHLERSLQLERSLRRFCVGAPDSHCPHTSLDEARGKAGRFVNKQIGFLSTSARYASNYVVWRHRRPKAQSRALSRCRRTSSAKSAGKSIRFCALSLICNLRDQSAMTNQQDHGR